MKKSLLLGMFLCGTTVSFAQKNAPIYTERLDSVISTGEAIAIKKNYEYNEDGSCTMTDILYNIPLYSQGNIAKMFNAKQITGYDKKGRKISVYTYNLDEEFPTNVFYTNLEYSYDDKDRVVVEKEYIPTTGSEQVTVSNIDYSGVSGYPKVVVIKLFINGEDTGMENRKYYNANDNEVLEEQGHYRSGKWKISHRYVTEYENNVKKSYTHYRTYEDGETFILDYQDLYVNGILKEHNEYVNNDYIYNYKKYDNYGNIIEEYNHEANGWLTHNYYKNTYDSEGRLTEKVCSLANADFASERSTYVYKKTKSGIAYYVETVQYLDNKWDPHPYSTSYYVQSKVEDGIVKDYSCLYTSYVNTDLWKYTSYDVQCDFYAKEIKDKVSGYAIYRFNGEEPAFLRKHDNYKFTKEKDFASYDLYRNPLLLENKGDNVTFIGTNEYVYDEKVLGSSIFMGESTNKKLLYEVLKDKNGKEVGRTTYYYSPYKATTTGITSVASPSDKAQAIYNLNGQKVTTTQAGQIYIQNGKKFIAK